MEGKSKAGLIISIIAIAIMLLTGGGSRTCDRCHDSIRGTAYHDSARDQYFCGNCYNVLKGLGIYR